MRALKALFWAFVVFAIVWWVLPSIAVAFIFIQMLRHAS